MKHPEKLSNKNKTMKLKKKFGEEIRLVVPITKTIRSWTQVLSGTHWSVHSLVVAEQPKPGRRGTD